MEEYSNEEIEEYLSAYGWSIAILEAQNSMDDAQWLMAECIFESELI